MASARMNIFKLSSVPDFKTQGHVQGGVQGRMQGGAGLAESLVSEYLFTSSRD